MRSAEHGGVSIAAARGPSLGGARGGIDALNAAVPIGRVSAPLAEGPVSTGDLNDMNILAKPISPKGEIRFGPTIEPSTTNELNTGDAISEAESILTEARLNLAQPKVGPGVIGVPAIKTGIENIQNPSPQIIRTGLLPKVESKLRVGVLPEVATHHKVNTNSVQRAQPSQETQLLTQEEVIFEPEEMMQEDQDEDYLETKEIEEQEKVRLLHIVDQAGVQRRTKHIFEVGSTSLREGKISGLEVIKNLLSANDPEVRGEEINRADSHNELADQTWVATVKRLAAMEFDCEAEFKKAVPEVVYKDHPVAVAQTGDIASNRSIENTHKTKAGKNHAVIELEKRKKKKIEQRAKVTRTQQQPLPVEVETKEQIVSEGTIHDHPELVEVFKLAPEVVGATYV